VDNVGQDVEVSRLADLSVSQSGQDATVAASRPWFVRGVLQVHNSFLVTEDEHGLVIIDQHALHERFMFEQLKHREVIRKPEQKLTIGCIRVEDLPMDCHPLAAVGPQFRKRPTRLP